jgi:hypothetical protein
MSTAPSFSPNPVDFGIVAPFSQTVIQVACPPLSTSAVVTAEISSIDPTFGITVVEPPPKIVFGPGGGVHGGSSGATGNVSQSATGSGVAGQQLDVGVQFTAPAHGTSASFAANLQISSPAWENPVSVPLQAQVGNLTLVCPPVSVDQARKTEVTVTVTAEGPATSATLSTQKSLPPGITVDLKPSTFNLVPGQSQSAKLTVTADIDAVPGTSDLTLYWSAFGNLTSFFTTQLTITKLSLQPSPIPAKYAAFPHAATVLGPPIGPEAFCDDYVGQYRAYQHGVIYWSGKSGAAAYEINGSILTRFLHSTNPEVGAPPGFPSAPPTLGDYASAPFAGFGYPITDTFLSKSGLYESRFENNCGIYATDLGTFVVATEGFYVKNGGSTSPLGLPIAESIGGSCALGWTFSFQDFENGAIYASFPAQHPPDEPNAIVFSQLLQGTGTHFSHSAGNGQTINGKVYLQPTPPPGFLPIPHWGVIAFAPDQVTKLVQRAVSDAISTYNKTAANPVTLTANATLQNPSVTGYSAFRNLAPIRQYIYGFSLGFSECLGFVSVAGSVQFELYFSLNNIEVISGPGQQISVLPINPSVHLSATNVPEGQLANAAKLIQNAVTSAAIPTIQFPATYQLKVGDSNFTAQLMGTSIKVLSDGTLCLFAAVLNVTAS